MPRPKISPARSRSHTITAACFSIQAVGIGVYIAYGVFFNPLMETFGWSRASISGASSVAFIFMGLLGILIGRLNDRFGPRILMSIAAVFFGLGFSLVSGVSALWQLYICFGLVFGIGLGAIDVIALTTIARWFSENRGKMTGIVKVGTGAGQFAFPILASFLIAGLGWQNAFLIIGIFAFVFLFAFAQVLERDPESAGLKPTVNKKDTRFSQTYGLPFSLALKTRALWLLCLTNLLLVFCLMSVLVHIVPHARDIGIPPHRAAGVLSAIGAVSMLGRFATGMAIDRIGSKRIMTVCFILLLTSLLWLIRADTVWKLYAFAGIYGVAHGGFFTAISPIMVELFGIRAHGSLFGMVVFFGTIGGALGPFFTGGLFDMSQSYTPAFWLLLAISAVSWGCLLGLKKAPIEALHT